ncbi:MAG: hypothetical protein B5M54_05670 [Candidatus Aminicenantes bacterium 4484_214]|nr:MAG: hypothetical protein B5M54_05670 [Candidatus Aminicenantes bacterium 4484_214]RLE09500.1 MAG: methyltransferase type 11 [Candidatus Aminicenantes bacterium]
MSNFKAKMFNQKAAAPKNKPDQIIEAIELKPGSSIADIGAGGGYFALRFAEIVGHEGKVYALDTNQEFLQFIQHNATEKGLKNIVTILIEEKPRLPEGSLDVIFMRNITHHLSSRVDYFKNLKRFLKEKGHIVIIDYKKSKLFTFRGLFGHHVPKKTIIREMEKAGYLLEKEFDFLPEQHFTIFSNYSPRPPSKNPR